MYCLRLVQTCPSSNLFLCTVLPQWLHFIVQNSPVYPCQFFQHRQACYITSFSEKYIHCMKVRLTRRYKMEDYKCNTCSKAFTKKRNLVRHMKNAHHKQQKHKCEICEKDFSRLSDLRRHKESTHYRTSEVQCSKCNKILNRADNIKYHKCKQTAVLSAMKDSTTVSNEAASSSIDAPPTNDKSFDEPPAKKIKYFKCFMKSDQHKNLENEELTESDPEVKDIMKKYPKFYKERKSTKYIQRFYDRVFKDLAETIAERIMIHQKNRFEINYSLAYIFKSIETENWYTVGTACYDHG